MATMHLQVCGCNLFHTSVSNLYQLLENTRYIEIDNINAGTMLAPGTSPPLLAGGLLTQTEDCAEDDRS